MVYSYNLRSVLNDYRGIGLNDYMTSEVLEEARARGYDLIASVSTSSYTQRNKIQRHQFQVVCEIDLKDNYLNYDRMPENKEATHTKACVLAKTLNS